MNVPGRISHYHIELSEHSEVEVPQVAIYPLRIGYIRLNSLASRFSLFVVGGDVFVFDVVNVLAFRIQAGV